MPEFTFNIGEIKVEALPYATEGEVAIKLIENSNIILLTAAEFGRLSSIVTKLQEAFPDGVTL